MREVAQECELLVHTTGIIRVTEVDVHDNWSLGLEGCYCVLISYLTTVRITEGLLSGDFETRQRIVSWCIQDSPVWSMAFTRV